MILGWKDSSSLLELDGVGDGVGVAQMFDMIHSSVVGSSVLTMRLMVRPSENWRKMMVANANQLMSSAYSCV